MDVKLSDIILLVLLCFAEMNSCGVSGCVRMSKERSGIIVIVGSNPLPNLIAVENEKPKEAILVYSQETSNVAKRLRKYYRGVGIATKDVIIRDATDSSRCKSVITDEMGAYRLDYTGGTKVMSASIHAEWLNRGGSPDRASYVDDRTGVIRFDDGRNIPLELSIHLDDILRIHGLNPRKERYIEKEGPTFLDAGKVAKKFLTDPDKLLVLSRSIGKKLNKSVRPEDYGLKLSKEMISSDLDPPVLTEWSSFLRGKWLELWIGGLIKNSGFVDTDKVHIGVEVQIREGHFELDVVVMHQHRAYLISCTTSTSIQTSKMKLFEAMWRARQIGGSLARAALIAPLGKVTRVDGKVIDRLVSLQQTAAEMWDSPNPPRIFGTEHMEEWAGVKGSQRLDSLYQWLQS
jgi:hypothetical protein